MNSKILNAVKYNYKLYISEPTTETLKDSLLCIDSLKKQDIQNKT